MAENHKMFLKRLSGSGILRSIGHRGAKGTAFHAVRRLGTTMEKALAGPEYIRINPMGTVCNHTCPMCWLQHLDPQELIRKKKEDRETGLKLEEYVRFFDGMTAGLKEVNLVGGGEPLVHRECTGIMREIKKRGWTGSLISNVSLLKEDIARQMIEMRWDSVRASVHAGDAETYKAIQGVDHFDAMRQNLKTYDRLRREAGVQAQCTIGIYHVLQHENIPHIERLFEIAEEVGADHIEFEKIIPYDAGKVLSPEEVHMAREKLLACARDSRIPSNTFHALPVLEHEEDALRGNKPFIPAKSCSVGYDQSFITSDGNVLPCCYSTEVMGNVRENSFKEIWYGEKYHNFRNRLINGKFAKYCISNRCALAHVLHN